MGRRERVRKFEDLYRTHSRAILGFLLRRTKNSHEAADALAEIMSIAWRRIDEVPDEPEAKLWLYGVARNVLRNESRSARRRARLVEKLTSALEVQIEDTYRVDSPDIVRLAAALDTLRPVEADVLKLVAWDQLEPSEVARLLDMPPETVRTHLRRGRLKLLKSLGHVVEDTELSVEISGARND